MSQGEERIVCRRCNENISSEVGNCPRCGASIRSTGTLAVVLLFGGVLFVTMLFNPGELLFFGLLGVALVSISGYLLYDKRERIKEANEQEPEQSESESVSA